MSLLKTTPAVADEQVAQVFFGGCFFSLLKKYRELSNIL